MMLVNPADLSSRKVSSRIRSTRVSIENWIFFGKRRIPSATAKTFLRLRPKRGSRNLNDSNP